MKHCKKLWGQAPSVKTKEQWENIAKEIKAVSPDPQLQVVPKKRTDKTNKNGQTWQACQRSEGVKKGPKS